MSIQIRSVATLGLLIIATQVCAQSTTTFTYQGELKQNGNLANGSFNMEFGLWNAASAGTQLDVMTISGVPVVDGRFSAELDFGSSNFNLWNQNRFLQIKVNGNTLSPRTLIARSPYSLQTRGIRVNEDASFVGVGRDDSVTTDEVFGIYKNTTGFAGMYVETEDNGEPFYGYSTGGSVDAYHYIDGASGHWQLVNNGGVRLTVTDDGPVGIGTTAPVYPLQVVSTNGASRAVSVNHPGITGSNIGVFAAVESPDGFGVWGDASTTKGTNVGVFGRSRSSSGRGVFGFAFANSGINYGVYGATESASGYDVYAGGAGINYGSSSSRRWKNNVEPIDNPLEKLAQLRGVYFDWDKDHGGHHDVGMIAEEVGKVLPEIVSYEENGIDADGMDYSKLTPLLVEAVKMLNSKTGKEIASLRARKDVEIKELQIEIAALRLIVQELVNEKEPSK